MGRPRKNPVTPPPMMEDPFMCSSAPPAAVPEPECRTCRYYDSRAYTCHRYPPGTTTVYPIKPEMWCGEHRA